MVLDLCGAGPISKVFPQMFFFSNHVFGSYLPLSPPSQTMMGTMLSHFQMGDVALIDFPVTADPSLITTSQKPEDVVVLGVQERGTLW